ncbi:VOC family protein [Streptomyces sp. NRRL B-1347]|uniref:VOC family protein n=1 Tax=Streptomyces sp. NRRL B-1347 TaxID=1476877 RepID=UPI0004C8F605|nr:VOC family protein [Streptomyces sp. NRRL B-1347]
MPIQLNHTIVNATDKKVSAAHLADLFGVEVQPPFGPFLPVVLSNGVALDYLDKADRTGPGLEDAAALPIESQHYAFLVSEDEFTAIFGRIKDSGIPYYADPYRNEPGRINHDDGGRGVYWLDPDGHLMEIITVPYGGDVETRTPPGQ